MKKVLITNKVITHNSVRPSNEKSQDSRLDGCKLSAG
jgi:hypothetical protein